VIKVAVVGGVAIYAFCLVLAAAGFTSIVPLIVLVPILVLLVGGGNLLGGRSHGRTRVGTPPGFDPAPLSSTGPNGPVATARTNGEQADTDSARGENGGPYKNADQDKSSDRDKSGGGEPSGGESSGGESGEHQ
jgi:hypothetical protein